MLNTLYCIYSGPLCTVHNILYSCIMHYTVKTKLKTKLLAGCTTEGQSAERAPSDTPDTNTDTPAPQGGTHPHGASSMQHTHSHHIDSMKRECCWPLQQPHS